jgi:hypothetical protein
MFQSCGINALLDRPASFGQKRWRPAMPSHFYFSFLLSRMPHRCRSHTNKRLSVRLPTVFVECHHLTYESFLKIESKVKQSVMFMGHPGPRKKGWAVGGAWAWKFWRARAGQRTDFWEFCGPWVGPWTSLETIIFKKNEPSGYRWKWSYSTSFSVTLFSTSILKQRRSICRRWCALEGGGEHTPKKSNF